MTETTWAGAAVVMWRSSQAIEHYFDNLSAELWHEMRLGNGNAAISASTCGTCYIGDISIALLNSAGW